MKLYIIAPTGVWEQLDVLKEEFAICEDYEKALAVSEKLMGSILELDTDKCDKILNTKNEYCVKIARPSRRVLSLERLITRESNREAVYSERKGRNQILCFDVYAENAEQAIKFAKQKYDEFIASVS